MAADASLSRETEDAAVLAREMAASASLTSRDIDDAAVGRGETAASASLTSPDLDDAAYGRRFAGDATESPDAAWARLAPHQVFAEPRFVVEPLTEDAGAPLLDPSAPDRYPPTRPGCVRLVCVSDTHGLHGKDRAATLALPAGDVLVHAGDFSNTGGSSDLASFAQWLGEQTQFAAKVVIAGNHDTSLDPPYYKREGARFHRNADEGGGADGRARAELRARVAAAGGVYLEDEAVEAAGLRFYGAPWQPFFCDWAFNLARGAPCRERWRRIPAACDVLVTHGPPLGRGDRVIGPKRPGGGDLRVGCVDLLDEVQARVRPRVHVFGHVHEGYGATSDGTTDFINASTCTFSYQPTNPPVVLDVPLPTPTNAVDAAEAAAPAIGGAGHS